MLETLLRDYVVKTPSKRKTTARSLAHVKTEKESDDEDNRPLVKRPKSSAVSLPLPDQTSNKTQQCLQPANSQKSSRRELTASRYIEIVNRYTISAFALPFYHLMALELPISMDAKQEAVKQLRSKWSTAHGGGRIINALLFDDEKVVPETSADVRGQSAEDPIFRNCRANEVFGCILVESEFGNNMIETSAGLHDLSLDEPVTRLQRAFYKFCETRKANVSKRHRYYKDWKNKADREAWKQRNVEYLKCWW